MLLIKEITNQPGTWLYWCPGCEEYHQVWTAPYRGSNWTKSGTDDKPTFAPSIKVTMMHKQVKRICHFFIRNGQIQYCGDSWHSLKNKTVPMVDLNSVGYGVYDS